MIACVSVPYFAAAVERRSDPGLAGKPLAIGGQPWEARPIYAFSQEAARQGVKAGMSLRLVQVLSPHSHFMPAAKTHYSQVSGEAIDVLTDFTPLIEPHELWRSPANGKSPLTAYSRTLPVHYCLDLEGLPQQEALPLVQEVGKSLRDETRLHAAIGLASTEFAARVAATVCRPDHTLPVKVQEEGEFLASRSLHFLPLEKEMARRLRLMGIQTLGQLAGLPLAALREQFGPQAEPLFRLARGEAPERRPPVSGEHEEEAQQLFDSPVGDAQILAAVSERLVAELAHRLQAGAWQGRRVRLILQIEDGTERRPEITLRRPTAAKERLAAVAGELLAREALPGPVIALKIQIAGLVPAQAQQLTLFNRTAVSAAAWRTIGNLAAKYRHSYFYQPVAVDAAHPLPERRFRLQVLLHDPLVA